MNGWDDDAFDRAYGPGAADEWGPRIDDDGPDYEETTELCPFCRAYLVYVLADRFLYCRTCDTAWDDLAAVKRDRAPIVAQGWAQ